MFLPISTCHDTEALRNVLAFFHVVWINCYLPVWIQLWPWQMVLSRTSHFLALSFFAVLKKHASHCSRHMTDSDSTQSSQDIVHAVICSCKFCACSLEILVWPHTKKIWLKIPLFRLRSVKMEQRKLNDQANTLVDLAKVSRQLLLFQHSFFQNEEFLSENGMHYMCKYF